MDDKQIDRLVDSVLYEGYLLYPYRPSLKNAKRWTFGAVYPAESNAARSDSERSAARARVLVVGDATATLGGQLRFLHLIERATHGSTIPLHPWHEAEERRVEIVPRSIAELAKAPFRQPFEVEQRQWNETDGDGDSATEVVRHQEAVRGALEIAADKIGDDVYLLSVSITNQTHCDNSNQATAQDAEVLRAFASAHLVLRMQGADFVSRIDPPAAYRDLCPNDPGDGLWPVFVGAPGEHDAMLCSPIILYDFPELAPESPGDFFDATEIDEMLTLRILTLSDEEKLQMAAHDARGRALLERTAGTSERQLAQLHGAMRSLRILEEPIDGN